MYLREPRPGVSAIGDLYLQTPRGSTRRFAMGAVQTGDVIITSPDQDPTTGEIQMPDDYVGSGPAPSTFDSGSDQVVATVGPIITAATGAVTSTVDWLKNALTGGKSAPVTGTVPGAGPAAASAADSGPNLLVLAALGGAGYLAYKHFTKKNKRKR